MVLWALLFRKRVSSHYAGIAERWGVLDARRQAARTAACNRGRHDRRNRY
jgi:hypothetical protein